MVLSYLCAMGKIGFLDKIHYRSNLSPADLKLLRNMIVLFPVDWITECLHYQDSLSSKVRTFLVFPFWVAHDINIRNMYLEVDAWAELECIMFFCLFDIYYQRLPVHFSAGIQLTVKLR